MKHYIRIFVTILCLLLCMVLCSAAAMSGNEGPVTDAAKPTPGPSGDPSPTEDSTKPEEFAITISNGSKTENKVEVVTLSSKSEKIKFTWPAFSGAQKYKVEIVLTSDKDHPVTTASQTKRNFSVAASELEAGRKYRITVMAMKSSKVLKTIRLTFKFNIAAKRPAFRRPQARKPSVTGDPARQGVTSGSALTGRHVYGSMDDTLYGALRVVSSSDAVNRLIYGDTALDILLDDGESAFFADVDTDARVLTLSPESAGESWSMTLADLKTLKLSGIETLSLTATDLSTSIRTDMTLSGRLYAVLKSQGLPDSDLVLTFDGNGMFLSTETSLYRVNGDLELEYDD